MYMYVGACFDMKLDRKYSFARHLDLFYVKPIFRGFYSIALSLLF